MTNFVLNHIGQQVSPRSIEDLCTYGMYGKVLWVEFNQVQVEWADGRRSWLYQSELELVEPQSQDIQP